MMSQTYEGPLLVLAPLRTKAAKRRSRRFANAFRHGSSCILNGPPGLTSVLDQVFDVTSQNPYIGEAVLPAALDQVGDTASPTAVVVVSHGIDDAMSHCADVLQVHVELLSQISIAATLDQVGETASPTADEDVETVFHDVVETFASSTAAEDVETAIQGFLVNSVDHDHTLLAATLDQVGETASPTAAEEVETAIQGVLMNSEDHDHTVLHDVVEIFARSEVPNFTVHHFSKLSLSRRLPDFTVQHWLNGDELSLVQTAVLDLVAGHEKLSAQEFRKNARKAAKTESGRDYMWGDIYDDLMLYESGEGFCEEDEDRLFDDLEAFDNDLLTYEDFKLRWPHKRL